MKAILLALKESEQAGVLRFLSFYFSASASFSSGF